MQLFIEPRADSCPTCCGTGKIMGEDIYFQTRWLACPDCDGTPNATVVYADGEPAEAFYQLTA